MTDIDLLESIIENESCVNIQCDMCPVSPYCSSVEAPKRAHIVEWAKKELDNRKYCIIHGCENTRDQVCFIGDLCSSCHDMLTTGKLRTTTSFLNKYYEMEQSKPVLEETMTDGGYCIPYGGLDVPFQYYLHNKSTNRDYMCGLLFDAHDAVEIRKGMTIPEDWDIVRYEEDTDED